MSSFSKLGLSKQEVGFETDSLGEGLGERAREINCMSPLNLMALGAGEGSFLKFKLNFDNRNICNNI